MRGRSWRDGPRRARLPTDHRPATGRTATSTVHEGVEALPVSVQEQQVAAARKAARDLAAAVEGLGRVFPPSVDLRRLAEDTARISVDLDLLAGVRTPQP